MTQYVSVDAAPTTAAPERKREDGIVAVGLLLLLVIIAVGAVICDASLTPEQRIEAHLQSGMFP